MRCLLANGLPPALTPAEATGCLWGGDSSPGPTWPTGKSHKSEEGTQIQSLVAYMTVPVLNLGNGNIFRETD